MFDNASTVDYPIIDAHMHPYIASDRSFAFDVPVDCDAFFAEQRRAGIHLSCGSFNKSDAGKDPEKLHECNQRVLEIQRHYPEEFYPGVNISPLLVKESCAAIERFYNMGFRWIGELGWYVMGYEKYNLPGMKEILDTACQLKMTVDLHPSTYEDIDQLLTLFPELKIVIAHPENSWGIMATYELAKKHENMLIDLSGSGLFRMGMLRKGVDMLGAERILFGTDFPVCNPAMNVAGVLFEKLSDRERRLIFRDNFLALISRL